MNRMRLKKYRGFLLPLLCLSILCVSYFGFIYIVNNVLTIGGHPIDKLERLQLTEKDFPAGWKFEYDEQPIPGDDEDWGEDNRLIAFDLGPQKGHASEKIWRFKNEFAAQMGYSEISKSDIVFSKPMIRYFEYKSPIANDWLLNCENTNDGGPSCQMLGRYDDFIVEFTIAGANGLLTSNNIEDLLRLIDNRMSQFLNK
jgi:hypothetical protein